MKYDVVIIGSGPGGYVAAIRAGQTGLKTALIEKDRIGGMCLNWGCIPSKSLLESAKRYVQVKDADKFGIAGVDKKKLSFDWAVALKRADRIAKKLTRGVEYLLKKNAVEVIQGTGLIESPDSVSVENRLLETKNIIIATGSRPVALDAPVPAEKVVELWALSELKELPQSVAVYGTGPNAVELAQVFAFAGSAVTLLVSGNELLPGADPFLSDFMENRLKKDGIKLFPDAKITGFEEGHIVLSEGRISADIVVNASLREAVLPESKVSIELRDGYIAVDEFLRTNYPNIFAVGDVNGRSNLAHAASAQGLYAVNYINGMRMPIDHTKYPLNIYSYPEMAQVGLTEQQLKETGVEYKASEFPLSANGKALIEDEIEGKVRILSETKYGEVLGVQIIAPHATDMIAEAAVLMAIEGTVFDLAKVIHAHPTVSEVFLEAGMAAVDKPIHI